MYMEKIYSEEQRTSGLAEACPETIAFLLNFSKSMFVTQHGELQFEGNLN